MTSESPSVTRLGMLLLVSGPSGSGKTTLCRRAADTGLASYATSCTTRAPRAGETHGTDYFFLSTDEFKQKISDHDLLEYAEVHGNFYGTLKSEVFTHIEAGRDVVMDIDVQGAEQIRICSDPLIQQALVELFVMPESEAELRARLTGRGTDSDDIIETRMRNSLEEMQHWNKYTYRILSSDRETDYQKFQAILSAERLSVSRIKKP
ncbi:MAG: guanylate kinase [Cryomorphaceae bacterium]|jgi:guanylate kinase